MKPSWLVQRLQPPKDFDNPFTFGGGYRHGGLTDEAFEFVSQVWSFDYMGAAEFEFGALPKALQAMVEATPWVSGTVEVEARFYDWETKRNRDVTGTINYMCPSELEDGVRQRIPEIARGDASLKERAGIGESLAELEGWETRGWLELDNGFLFLSDETMFDNARKVFGELFEEAA